MVWAAVSVQDETNQVILSEKMNLKIYNPILETRIMSISYF